MKLRVEAEEPRQQVVFEQSVQAEGLVEAIEAARLATNAHLTAVLEASKA